MVAALQGVHKVVTEVEPIASARTGRPLVGVALVVGATFLFALGDTVAKLLVADHPVAVVQAGRYLVNLVLLAALLGPRHGRRLWRTERTGLVVLRALLLAAASLTMGLALQRMPVGETVAIIYLAPFLVMLLAGPLLGERVGGTSWIAAMLAFGGVLLVVRPGTGLDTLGVMFALVNAGFGAGYHLLTRVLARTETMMSMLFHVALTGSVVFAVMAAPDLPALTLTAVEWGLVALLGVLATAGHFLFTAAYREAQASYLAPVNYLHIVWATALGWAVFAHAPDGVTLAGIALVLVAGTAAALLPRRATKAAA
ncbi:MAG: permease [Rhodobacter sp. CACIA14H1]|nr:MAG: permease [Rhodobacter sp. CACIA14H1]